MKKLIFILSCFAFQQSICYSQDIADTVQTGGLFNADEKPQLIAKQFSFTEGSSVDKKGNVFFSDQPNDKIWEYSVDHKLSVFLDNAGRSNGTSFDNDGNLITCAETHDQIWSISPDKKIKVLVTDFNGK